LAQKIQWERLQKIDFFKAPNRARVKAILDSTQKLFEEAKTFSLKDKPEPPHQLSLKTLRGRTWVTRTSPHIDRIACAWLIQRFIDSKARFKFVTEPYKPRGKNELRFDMTEGEFTHFGDWCSFETFLHRLQLDDPALQEMGEIIHDIDLKDHKFHRPEAVGLAELIRGLCIQYPNDQKRINAGLVTFESLFLAIQQKRGGRK
jgi:hypothetical protein